MQTSVAVFLAFVVIYAGCLVMPLQVPMTVLSAVTRATTATGAVATFMVMHCHNVGLLHSSLVVAALSVLVALSVLASISCTRQPDCQNPLPVHTMLFSSSFLSGAMAYAAFVVGRMLGLPLWAGITASILFAPIALSYILPVMSVAVEDVLKKLY